MALSTTLALLLAGLQSVSAQDASYPASTAIDPSRTSSGTASFVTSVELSVDGTCETMY